ncbi:sugar phosphate nucleotidyltransferase [Alkalicoccobacillus murimartini]|uniref:Glucose-1-phosphate adenylyltransferase n=1 Tax=Alkalicoccobacillus murimartini TaxID=171685 RepID=A0ABT9YBQ8_9BACI|nr:sugar phosphate nucleotidyltransferase [Alkalicoccobacillus murimartini]MDQ0205281.1 glucose-1-phosphate adenylyltransferase [Alkalicoccobacillus murimartini]
MNSVMNCLALVLAGGAGTRLGALTKEEAKPAVSFGGKFRIIDFTLSNCSRSGIQHVGVLTQYKPETLHSHLQNNDSWGMNIDLLPSTDSLYSGTADAVYKNLEYAESFQPSHVLVLSGDHIYQMDYEKMMAFHLEKDADVTVASIQVPFKEASRYGILHVNPHDAILEFQEKPVNPTSNNASMGIYLFKWQTLKKHLLADADDSSSAHDFGKDILPTMLKHQEKLFAFPYEHYWRDVGTIQSYWQTQMDLANTYTPFEENQKWPLFASDPPHGLAFSVQSSSVPLHQKVCQSVVSPSATISEGSVIKQSVILPGSYIGKNVTLHKVIVAENTYVPDNFSFGSDDDIMLITQADIQHELSSIRFKSKRTAATNQLTLESNKRNFV